MIAAVMSVLTGCGKKPGEENQFTVLVRMMPAQQRYFREEIVQPFEKKYNCKINIATFTNQWDIENMLKLEIGKKKAEIGLVKTPFEMTRGLVDKGYIKSLNEIIDPDQVSQDMAEYHPLASGLGYIEAVPYYIPRKLETRIQFYRKSMVADAVLKFEAHKERIGKELKKHNGYGLPAGYALEPNPNEWDFYDLYVIGSIWANEKYNDLTVGRLAHRGARYEGTTLDLLDKALQLGASSEDILNMIADPIVNMFVWERALIRIGAYNPGMWQDPWRGSNIYNAIKDGKAFLANLQQIDCFLVHGWDDDPGMPTYLPDMEDMGLSLIPRAVSFELDSAGVPVFEGTRAISTGGWWWGIPQTSPNPKLAYEFARFITNKENQARECSRFGMIPVRKDLLNNLPQVFDEGWVGEIFKVSTEQIKTQLQDEKVITVPRIKQYAQMGQNYVDAWYKLCVEYKESEEEPMNFSMMKTRVASDFQETQQKILGSDYPE